MFYVLLVFLHLQTQYISIIFILLKRFLLRISICLMDSFPHSLVGKESACNVGGLGSIPGLRRASGEGKGYPFQYLQHSRIPTPVFWPREFHGLYSPWGHKELDTTERLSITHSQMETCSPRPPQRGLEVEGRWW